MFNYVIVIFLKNKLKIIFVSILPPCKSKFFYAGAHEGYLGFLYPQDKSYETNPDAAFS